MLEVTSFSIDHRRLEPGLYVSWEQPYRDMVHLVLDLRLRRPNRDPIMSDEESHSYEHGFALSFRKAADELGITEDYFPLYFGPMGCKTGFYIIFSTPKIGAPLPLDLLIRTSQLIDELKAVPARSSLECGHFHSLELAALKRINQEVKEILYSLKDAKKDRNLYPGQEGEA